MLFHGTERSAPTSRASRCAAGLAAVGLALGLSACEPTAFIAKIQHDLSSIQSPGAVGEQCTETSADLRPQLRFTLTDTNSAPIFPGDRLGSFDFRLGDTFGPDDLRINSERGTLFPAPDIDCEPTQVGAACPDADLAAAGFTCQPISETQTGGDAQARVVCALSDFSVEVGPNASIGFEGDESDQRAVMLLVANGVSLLGIDSQGRPDRLQCSSDPTDNRESGARLLLTKLSDVDSNPFARQTELCVGTFAGQSEADYQFAAGDSVEDCFYGVLEDTDDEQAVSALVGALGGSETSGGRNPWAAVADGAGRFNAWSNPNALRHIVLFTDGDVSEDALGLAESQGLNLDRAQQEAINNEVTVHIVQLDNRGLDASSDACQQDIVHGAVEGFQRLACATGGTFQYVENPSDLGEAMTNIANVILGRYEVELVTEQIATLPLGPYKLAFTLTATVGDSQASYEFAALAGSTSVTTRQDTRVTLINRGDCATRGCRAGYVCDDRSATCQAPEAGSDATPVVPDGSGEGA